MVNGLIIINFKLYFLPPRYLSVADGGENLEFNSRSSFRLEIRASQYLVMLGSGVRGGGGGGRRPEMTGMVVWERNGVNCVTGKLDLILVGEMYLISFWLEYVSTRCSSFKKKDLLGFNWGCCC